MKLLALVALILFAGTVQAQLNLEIVNVTLNETGHASVQQLLSLDSTRQQSIEVTMLDSQNLRVFDAQGTLSFQLDGNRVSFQPRIASEQYGATVEYETDRFTSKQGSNWFFELKTGLLETAAERQVKVSFPSNAKVVSFEPVASVFLESGKIELEWQLQESNAAVKAQYSFEEQQNNPSNYAWLVVGIVLVLAVGAGYYWFSIRKKTGQKKEMEKNKTAEKRAEPGEKKPVSRQQELLRFLNGNEKRVMDELLKENGITQRSLHVRTGLPKSTLSRTIQRLQAKELVEVHEIGNTNRIELGKAFKED